MMIVLLFIIKKYTKVLKNKYNLYIYNMSGDNRRPCNCGNPTNTIGDQVIPGTTIGRTTMGRDYRLINGVSIIHEGYNGSSRACPQINEREQLIEDILESLSTTSILPSASSSTTQLLTDLREIDNNNNRLLNTSRTSRLQRTGHLESSIMGTEPSMSIINSDNINPQKNGIDSIIKSITIRGESNSVGVISDWNANTWQNNNINIKNGHWLSTETPYVFNFGKFDQFGRTISVKDIKNKEGNITWAITADGEIIKQSITLTIQYITDYYNNKNIKSVAEVDLIDIGNTSSSFCTNLSCKKTIKENKFTSNIVTVQYDISWNPILETITDKSVNLKQLIVRLSNYKDKSSADKLAKIMEEINQSINNTKLSVYIRYGPDKDELCGIGSLLAINVINN